MIVQSFLSETDYWRELSYASRYLSRLGLAKVLCFHSSVVFFPLTLLDSYSAYLTTEGTRRSNLKPLHVWGVSKYPAC